MRYINFLKHIFIILWCTSAYAQDFSISLKNQFHIVPLYQYALVKEFYEQRNYTQAWSRSIDISIFISSLLCASDEGLTTDDYHYKKLLTLFAQSNKKIDDITRLEILLTDAFMHYGMHLAYGKVDPSKIYDGIWEVYPHLDSLTQILTKALNERSIIKAIEELKPQHKGYKQLQRELLKYKSINIKNRLPEIKLGSSIEPTMTDPRIFLIRERLRITENINITNTIDSCTYDSLLFNEIKKFQAKHGLVSDGIIGRQTLDALNTPIEKYIQKIIINMERYRWLPRNFSQCYLSINIPDFFAQVMTAETIALKMKIIIGKPDRKTPVLHSEIHYLIINPTWTVPPTILKEDALPAIKRNINYLKKNNLKVINRKGEEINPTTIPWEKYSGRNFPYQLVQEPGPSNSLGLIKFQFPNNHRVFLHDTNASGLFSSSYRALSSGCIRVEHPFMLASYILKETKWSVEKLNKMIDSGKTQTITLPQPMPLHIFYFTTFINEQNEIQFRNDIYGWDSHLSEYFPIEKVHF